MDLVRDLLDKQIVDRNGREMGRVDSVLLEHRDDGAPRIVGIEIGPTTLGYRVRPIFGRWIAAIEYAFGIGEGRPVQIPVGKIVEIGDKVKVDLALTDTNAGAVEQALRRIIVSIPGGQR